MWKKEEVPNRPAGLQPDAPSRPERPTPTGGPTDQATIGRSISIRGDVTGDEDLFIQGRVEGSVDLQQNTVTVGPEGEVKASIVGRVVTVEGRVEGNIRAAEQVVLRSTAAVEGDITSPRLVLEDGARFRGGVDMGAGGDEGPQGRGATLPQSRRRSEPDAKAADRSAPEAIGGSTDPDASATDAAASVRI
jgi:cytoskeletal protein CcmA (bactofilin family)